MNYTGVTMGMMPLPFFFTAQSKKALNTFSSFRKNSTYGVCEYTAFTIIDSSIDFMYCPKAFSMLLITRATPEWTVSST